MLDEVGRSWFSNHLEKIFVVELNECTDADIKSQKTKLSDYQKEIQFNLSQVKNVGLWKFFLSIKLQFQNSVTSAFHFGELVYLSHWFFFFFFLSCFSVLLVFFNYFQVMYILYNLSSCFLYLSYSRVYLLFF